MHVMIEDIPGQQDHIRFLAVDPVYPVSQPVFPDEISQVNIAGDKKGHIAGPPIAVPEREFQADHAGIREPDISYD